MSESRFPYPPIAFVFVAVMAAKVLAQEAGTEPIPATQAVADDPSIGVVLVHEMRTSAPGMQAPPQRMTVKVLGREARMDIGDQATTFQRANGETVTLMHAQRTYITVTPSLVKEALERVESMQESDASDVAEQAESEKTKFKATGERKRIGGYEAVAYDFTPMAGIGNGVPTRYWFAADYPEAESIGRKMALLMASHQFFGVKASEIPAGVVVRTETRTPLGAEFIVDTVSAKLERVDKALFEMPAGYRKMEMPQFPK